MKQLLVLTAFFFALASVYAQEDYSEMVKVGDLLYIDAPSANSYKHIDIPRKNFIIKRGGIANMSSIRNTAVIVTKIDTGNDPKVTFKKSNGSKFFNAFRTMSADLNKAIESGELEIRNTKKKDSLTR
ncbi:hypothetical protein [uncultured Croceitalea sp.]|uniref:hypothetical protein n=1 Tax=uncultured Croceitalea sp. TaxID=1798908 RepID=UPI0033059603